MWPRLTLLLLIGCVDGFSVPQQQTLSRTALPPSLHGFDHSRVFHANKHGSSTHSQPTPTQLFHSPGGVEPESMNLFLQILTNPLVWSSLVMLSIVGLLYAWEEAVENLRQNLPQTLMPVLDSMLAEVGGLGFVGLFLGTVVTNGPLGEVVEHISEEFLGDGEILLETFEFLHEAFFEVGIAFFTIAGLTVYQVLQKLASLAEFRRTVFDTNRDGKVELGELADFLNVKSIPVDTDGDGVLAKEEISVALRTVPNPPIWEELRMTNTQIKAEALVVRERFIETRQVSPDFQIDVYFSKVFGEKLKEIVELSPLTWLPLIPALALGNSVDFSRDVISSASANAFVSCGYFLGTPSNLIASSVIAFVGWTWGCWNFWKMTQIKHMLTPVLVRDSVASSEARLLPPKYEDAELLRNFNSSPYIFGWIESFFAQEATNDQERLFGVAGAAGPSLYLKSIKFQIWLVISQIVFWGTQIVARDASALLQHAENVGNPELLVPELVFFSTFVVISLAQLTLAPQTFLKYCLVTSIEKLAIEHVLDDACTYIEDDGTGKGKGKEDKKKATKKSSKEQQPQATVV